MADFNWEKHKVRRQMTEAGEIIYDDGIEAPGIGILPEERESMNPKDRLARSEGKAPLHYLEPVADEQISRALKSGAEKYGYRNFTIEPIKATVYIDALLRHINAWRNGEDVDPDSREHPLAHIGANVHVALTAMAAGKFIDDRGAEVKK